jgi:hypothetical protein
MQAELKTQKNEGDVQAFLAGLEDEQKRQDSQAIVALMQAVSGLEPRMWGESIVGFGDYHYKYATGREGDTFQVGFSPRKQNLTIYLTYGFEQRRAGLDGDRLGKYKTGKACLYVRRLADVDLDVLRELVRQTVEKFAEELIATMTPGASTTHLV